MHAYSTLEVKSKSRKIEDTDKPSDLLISPPTRTPVPFTVQRRFLPVGNPISESRLSHLPVDPRCRDLTGSKPIPRLFHHPRALNLFKEWAPLHGSPSLTCNLPYASSQENQQKIPSKKEIGSRIENFLFQLGRPCSPYQHTLGEIFGLAVPYSWDCGLHSMVSSRKRRWYLTSNFRPWLCP